MGCSFIIDESVRVHAHDTIDPDVFRTNRKSIVVAKQYDMSLLNRNIEQKNDLESNRVNIGEDDELTLQGYEPSFVRSLGLFILYILSCGIFVILTSWRPGMKIRIANRQCSLEHAKLLIVRVCIFNYF